MVSQRKHFGKTWFHVVFRDEACFEPYRHDGHVQARFGDGEKHSYDCILLTILA